VNGSFVTVPNDRPMRGLGRPLPYGHDFTTLQLGLDDLGCAACTGLGCMECGGGCKGMGDLTVRPQIETGLGRTEDLLNKAAAILGSMPGGQAAAGAGLVAGLQGKARTIRDMLPTAFDAYQALVLEARVQKLEEQASRLLEVANAIKAKQGGLSDMGAFDSISSVANLAAGEAQRQMAMAQQLLASGNVGGPVAPPAPPKQSFLQKHGKKLAIGAILLLIAKKKRWI
jgi:hypothetical protein